MLSKIITCSALLVGLLLVQVGADKSCSELESTKELLLSKTPTDLSADSIYSLIVDSTSQYCPDGDHNGMRLLQRLKQIHEVSCNDQRFEELTSLKHFLALHQYSPLIGYFEHQRSRHVVGCKLDMTKQLKGRKFDTYWTSTLAFEVFLEKHMNQTKQLKVTPSEFQESFARFYIGSRGPKLDIMMNLGYTILTDIRDAFKKCNKFEKNLEQSYHLMLLVEDENELKEFDESAQEWIKMARVCQYLNNYSDIDSTIVRDQLAIKTLVLKQLYQLHEHHLLKTLQYDSSKLEKKCIKTKGCSLEKLVSLKNDIFAGKESQSSDYNLAVNNSDFDLGFIKYFSKSLAATKRSTKQEQLEEELIGISGVCRHAWLDMKKMRKILLQFTYWSQIRTLNDLAQNWIKIFRVCEYVVLGHLSENKKVDDFVKVYQIELINKV